MVILLIIFYIISIVNSVVDTEYYDLFEVQPTADDNEIKRAFKRLSLLKHPDKNPQYAEEYVKITEAYEVLSNPDTRHMYDMYGKDGVEKFKQQQRTGQQNPLNNFFGFGQQQQHQKTNDMLIEVEADLREFYLGGQRSISYNRNVICKHCRGTGAEGGETKICPKCNGSGQILVEQNIMPGFRMQTQRTCPQCNGKGRTHKHSCNHCHGSGMHTERTTLDLIIEKGMKDQEEIRFERKSEERPGHIPGDVIVKLKQVSHPYIQRDGDNLKTSVELTLEQALLGFDLNIQHLDSRYVNLKHNGVTYHGKIRKYKNEGMPHHSVPSDFGDLFIEYYVKFPDKLSQNQKNTLLKLFSNYTLKGEVEQ